MALLDGEAEALTRKAVDLALDGDTTALRLCLERIAPPQRDAHVSVALPPIKSSADAARAAAAVLDAVAMSELIPARADADSRWGLNEPADAGKQQSD